MRMKEWNRVFFFFPCRYVTHVGENLTHMVLKSEELAKTKEVVMMAVLSRKRALKSIQSLWWATSDLMPCMMLQRMNNKVKVSHWLVYILCNSSQANINSATKKIVKKKKNAQYATLFLFFFLFWVRFSHLEPDHLLFFNEFGKNEEGNIVFDTQQKHLSIVCWCSIQSSKSL